MNKPCYTFLLLVISLNSFGQQSKIDSLLSLLKKDKDDTNKVIHLKNLCWEYQSIGNYDTALYFGNAAVQLGQQLIFKKGIAGSYGNIGSIYRHKGDYLKALDYYFKALRIGEEIGDKNRIAIQLGNIGIVYWNKGDYPKALDYYVKALKIDEELGDKKGIARHLGNIAIVYADQASSPLIPLQDREGLYSKALEYYFKALKTFEELGDKGRSVAALGNIGNVYANQKNYPKALEYFFEALKIAEEIGDKNRIAIYLGNIGSLYTDIKTYDKAERYLVEAIRITKEIGALYYEKSYQEKISEVYEKTGKPAKALKHYKQYSIAKDSLLNEEKDKEITRKEMNYQFEKKEAMAKAEQDKKDTITAAEKQRQKVVIYAVSVGLFLVLLLALFIFRGYRQKQKANKELAAKNSVIEEQKKIVEEKNKDITDSINYAQRIQTALLAGDGLLNKNLGEYFILFKPKDIVSGDFYWATEKEGRFYLAVCDCTGHGVPGAFMSLLNISFLNEAINEKEIEKPNEVFDHVRQRLIENISSEGAKDGMDGILICFDSNKKEISYSSAHNAPMLMNGTLQELDTDSMPVGLGEKKDSFTHHTISVQSGNILYLYTDGFADQFGGPKGKKFKYRQLNDLLSANSSKSLSEQKNILEKTFEDWKGNLEQVDDVLVIGIKI